MIKDETATEKEFIRAFELIDFLDFDTNSVILKHTLYILIISFIFFI